MRSPSCLFIPLLTSECLNQSLWNLVLYHGAWAHLNGILNNASNQCVSVCVCCYATARKNVTAATNKHARIEELLDPFYMRSVSCKATSPFQNFLYVSRDSAVGIATGYRLDIRGVRFRIPVEARILSSLRRSDGYWSPPSLLTNRYRGLFLPG
jgi:hypothetical protein